MQDNSYIGKKRRELEQEFFKEGLTSEQIRLLGRVEEMLGKAFQAGYKMAEMFQSEQWSNNACLGYAIIGAKKLKYTEDQTKKLVRSINSEFDFKSIDDAKSVYNNSPY
jgi:hypothetical protein